MSTLTQFQREPQIIKNYNNFVLKYTLGENSENNQDVEKSHLVVNWWHRRERWKKNATTSSFFVLCELSCLQQWLYTESQPGFLVQT